IGFDDPENSTNVTSSAVSCPDDSLLLSCVVLRNPGRTVTAVAPTQITTKYLSLAESGNRATWQQYRTVTTAATVSTESTLDSSGGFTLITLAFVPAGPPPGDWAEASLTEWDGDTWEPITVTEWD